MINTFKQSVKLLNGKCKKMSEQSYLITFMRTLNGDCMKNFAGFKIFGKEQAKVFMKSVKKLEAGNCSFDFDDLQFSYALDDFNLMKISATERKSLEHLFGIEIEDGQIVIFPDAISDAIDFNVYDEYEKESDEDSYNDDEY